jgi:hypothetical protein
MNMKRLPYDGTAGFVNASASRERAFAEAADGTASARQETVLAYLRERGPIGATWAEAGNALGLHHGQVSGALSVLHLAGEVFALRKKRNRSHVYVHGRLRESFLAEARIDTPAKTRNTRIREEAVILLEAAIETQSWRTVSAALALLNDEA